MGFVLCAIFSCFHIQLTKMLVFQEANAGKRSYLPPQSITPGHASQVRYNYLLIIILNTWLGRRWNVAGYVFQ